MTLLEQAAADLVLITRDEAAGFGVRAFVTDPDEWEGEIVGLTADIGLTLDMDSGQQVATRQASISFALIEFEQRGMALPQGVQDTSRKPWTVRFPDASGKSHTFKIVETMPDRSAGLVVCMLEVYKRADD